MARGRTKKEEGKVPLSSLIDIVFLLIFFFVFTITVKNEQIDKNVQLAKSYHMELAKTEKNSFTINVRSSPTGARPSYTIGGRSYPLNVKTKDGIPGGGANSIEGKLRQAQEKYGDSVTVIIRASADLEFQWIQEINEVVGNANLYKVRHHTIGAEE